MLTDEEIQQARRRRLRENERARAARANLSEEARAKIRERDRIRTAEKRRRQLTPEGRQKQREITKARSERQRLARSQMSLEEKSKFREKERLRFAQKRKIILQTAQEGRTEAAASALYRRAHDRINLRICRLISSDQEEKMIKELRIWRARSRKGGQSVEEVSLEKEEDMAWKEAFYAELNLEFLNQRNLLCEEALEIEMGPNVPFTESPLSNEDWCGVVESSNNYSSTNSAEGDGAAAAAARERETVRNRWKGVVNQDSDNEEDVNDVIKVEAEEYNDTHQEDYNHEGNEVVDWIVSAVTEGEGQEDNLMDVSSTTTTTTPREQQGRARRHPLSIVEEKTENLKKLWSKFLTARQNWITSKPEDSDKRAQLDQDRVLLKERLKMDKTAAVEKLRRQLIHKRDFYSQETQAVREARIARTHQSYVSGVSHREKSKTNNSLPLTEEERRAKRRKEFAAAAVIRIRMERLEYELYLLLMEAAGFSTIGFRRFNLTKGPSGRERNPIREKMIKLFSRKNGKRQPPGSISISDFEEYFQDSDFADCITHWVRPNFYNTHANVEISSYRKLLYEFLSTRKNLANNNKGPEQEQQPETVKEKDNDASKLTNECPPEVQSLQDIQRFKDFITKYGDTIKEHLTFKAFYGTENSKKKLNRLKDNPEEVEKFKKMMNERVRRAYILKKYGVELKEGEYFDKATMSSVPKEPRAKYGSKRQAKKGDSSSSRPSTRKKRTPSKKALASRACHDESSSSQQHSALTNESNDMDYSNSSANDLPTTTASRQYNNNNSDDDDGWMPLGSFRITEMDTEIRNEVLNFPNNQLHQNMYCPPPSQNNVLFQQQSQGRMYLRSGGNNMPSSSQHHYPFVGHIPSLQLVDHNPPTNQMNSNFHPNSQQQWNNNQQNYSQQQPFNYSLPFLPNSTSTPQQAQNLQQPSYGDWTSPTTNTSRTNTMSSNYEMPHLQPQTSPQHNDHTQSPSSSLNMNSNAPSSENDDEEVSSPTTPRKRGRPKGWKKTSLNTPVATSSYAQSQSKISKRYRRTSGEQRRRDIWNNFKRNKFYGLPTVPRPRNVSIPKPVPESPFLRDVQIPDPSLLLQGIKCHHCELSLPDLTALKSHIRSKHRKQSTTTAAAVQSITEPKVVKRKSIKLPCAICSAILDSKDLIRHLFQVHYIPAAKDNPCPFGTGTSLNCSKSLFDRENLRKHLPLHHSEEIKSSWVMDIHSIPAIADKDKYYCISCPGKFFSTYSDLKEHCKDTHDKVRYCCVYCGIYFKKQDLLIDHTKLFHPEEPERSLPIPSIEIEKQDLFTCDGCDSEFSAESFLEEHQKLGHTLIRGDAAIPTSFKKQYPCVSPACTKQFNLEEERDNHFNTNCASRSYECYWCKKQWSSKRAVSKHISEVHPLEPPVPSNHMESYMGKPYKCELCVKEFISLYFLRLHCINEHQLFKYLQENSLVPAIIQTQDPIPQNYNKSNSSATTTTSTRTTTAIQVDPVEFSCGICNISTNIHYVHKEYDKLMIRYCVPCDRLLSRPVVLIQHNEAAHGILAKDTKASIKESGHPPPPAGDANFKDWVICTCSKRCSFTHQEFHQLHTFVAKHSTLRTLQQEDYDKLSATITLPAGTAIPGSTGEGEITIFSCRVCFKNFKTLAFLRIHIARDHAFDAFTRVLCKKCNTTYTSKELYEKHDRLHHAGPGNVKPRYLCPVCDKVLSKVDKVGDHCRRFHPDYNFKRSEVKTAPIDPNVQANQDDLTCKMCSKTYPTAAGLKCHITTKHIPLYLSPFCDTCGLQSKNLHAYKGHIFMHHPEVYASQDKPKPKPVKPGEKYKKVSLPEIVAIIHDIYDKTGVTTFNPTTTKVKLQNKSSKRKSNQKKKMQNNDSEEEEDDDEESQMSDMEEDNYDDFDINEEQDEKPQSLKNPRKKSVSVKNKKKVSKPPKNMAIQSINEEQPRKRSTRQRRKSFKIIDNNTDNSENDSDHEEEKEKPVVKKRTTAKTNIQRVRRVAVSDSEETSDSEQNEDRDSDIDFCPEEEEEFKPNNKRLCRTTARRITKTNNVAASSNNRKPSLRNSARKKRHDSTVSYDGARELVICLERCDKVVDRSSKTYKPKPKSRQFTNQSKFSEINLSPVKEEVIIVKDEIMDWDNEDAHMMDDINNLNMKTLSPTPSNWQYVDIQPNEEDDDLEDEFHLENDPFSGV